MRSADRTLIQQLSFGDPDKGNVLHDRACQFLCSPAIAADLLGRYVDVIPPKISQWEWSNQTTSGDGSGPRPFKVQRVRNEERVTFAPAKFTGSAAEVHLTKGDRYSTTVGFLDVVIRFGVASSMSSRVATEDMDALAGWKEKPHWVHRGRLCVEVKILPVAIGDLLRQINLYREYVPSTDSSEPHSPTWLVATAYDLPLVDRESLKAANIRYLRLGPRFDRFCQEAQASASYEREDIL